MTTYILRQGEEAPEETAEKYRELIARREAREPLQYITGTAPFFGREFRVRPGVLIPRFDTETLVEALLPRLLPGMRLLDLCTGSGCVLISLLLSGPGGLSGTGTDVSVEALAVAQENAELLGADAEFVRADLFPDDGKTYDLISANPPYIRSELIPGLDPEVSVHEPRLALDGGADGLDFYRRITAEVPGRLADGGVLGVEIGYDQAEDVVERMKNAGFTQIAIHRDLGWNTRAVTGVKDGSIC